MAHDQTGDPTDLNGDADGRSADLAALPCDEECLFRSSDDVRQGFVRRIESVDVRPVTYNVIEGVAIFEGDIALGHPDQVDAVADAVRSEAAGDDLRVEGVGIVGMRFRWPNGLVPWVAVAPLRAVVLQAIQHIEASTRIRFVERTAANAARFPDFLSFEERDGCWSAVGRQGGLQVVSLGTGCGTRGIAVHEICHALGLWHEQSREDRDRNVRIVWGNIQAGREHNFNQHITDGDDLGAYDFGSIMHYGARAFSSNNQDTIVALGGQAIGQRTGLSPGDIATIRALYPELEPSQSWRGTQFSASVAPNTVQEWFTHSWPAHWFVNWTLVPTNPPVDGNAQLELVVRTSRQADRAAARLVKYHFAIRNLTGGPVGFEVRYEVLGWHSSFL